MKTRLNLGKSMGLEDDNDIRGKSDRHFSLVGTEDYIAPETVEDREVSYSADLWSLGIIIYQMLCGETPFKGRTILETYQNIRNNELKFDKDNLDPMAKDLVARLLVKEPTLRIGAEDFEELKRHPYFDGIDWDNLRNNPAPYNPVKRPPRMLRSAMSNVERSRVSGSFSKTNND
jgi:3-phosphoinositide dependent protein kinase-1